MKICSKCKIEKELDFFSKDKGTKDGFSCWCKECKKEKYLAHRELNLDSERARRRISYEKNKDNEKEINRRWATKNRDKNILRVVLWRKENKLRVYKTKKEWKLKNRAKLNEQERIKRETNPQLKIRTNLRSRLCNALGQRTKKVSSIKDLGCTIDQLRDWIERQWESGMSWDNYGKKEKQWSIDHEYPLSLVDVSKRELCLPLIHYTNLQPMWHTQNMSKNNSLI